MICLHPRVFPYSGISAIPSQYRHKANPPQGSGGGPIEDNATGFLIRATSSRWAKNSVLAVDAGSHLSAITRLLETHFPLVSETLPTSPSPNVELDHRECPSPGTIDGPGEDFDARSASLSIPEIPPTMKTLDVGPFAGLPFPHASARANALHVVREHVSTYLITHPHLDHVSGFVINTAAFHNTSRPKRLAALPFTVNAIKKHLFNNVIWPNLTDEDGGVGLVTFQRLGEGGNIAIGEGSGRGYIEVVDGLSVKGFKVSHGHCMRGVGHVHRGSNANLPESNAPTTLHPQPPHHSHTITEAREGRAHSFSLPSQPGTPLYTANLETGRVAAADYEQCVIDSSAYFIRTSAANHSPAREVLIFGDVEPDSISLSPRTRAVWMEAAPKIANGTLTGIFIECSYSNSQGDGMLYGHLCPRHLLDELQNLADLVREARKEHEREKEELRKGRKRKRASNGFLGVSMGDGGAQEGIPPRKSSRGRVASQYAGGFKDAERDKEDEVMTDYSASPKTEPVQPPPDPSDPSIYEARTTPTAPTQAPSAPVLFSTTSLSAEHNHAIMAESAEAPLRGVKVVIIHVKDIMADGPLIGEEILAELREGEAIGAQMGRALGCEFEVSKVGESYWF